MTIPQEEAAVRLPPFCFRLPAVFRPVPPVRSAPRSIVCRPPARPPFRHTDRSERKPSAPADHPAPFSRPGPPHGKTSARPHSISILPADPIPAERLPKKLRTYRIRTNLLVRSSPSHETYGKNRRVRRGLAPRRSPVLPDASREKPSGKKIRRPAALIRKRTTPRAGACLRTAGRPGEKLRRRKSRLILESYKKDLFSCRFADTETASANGSKGRKPERHDTGTTQRPALFP